jgi:hypothetical protein
MTVLDGGGELEALRTDRYLESLLFAERGDVAQPVDAALDPGIRFVAERLRQHLVPVHPSFRFEERLGNRLAEAARAMRLVDAAGAEGEPIALPGARGLMAFEDLLDEDDGVRFGRPLLIGGALTSAALSLAGAAFVAWRHTRSVRTVDGRRLD